MSIFEIDNNFVIPPGFNPEMLDAIPVRPYYYGGVQERIPTELYWLEYQPHQSGDGTISFARRLRLHYPDVADYVADYLNRFFPTIKFDSNRVALIRTIGSIMPHIDEGRITSANIGIKNTLGAITKSSATSDKNLYPLVAQTWQCKDNHAYLLNTNKRHEVIATNNLPRYLFTYGFGMPFSEIMKYYKKPLTA